MDPLLLIAGVIVGIPALVAGAILAVDKIEWYFERKAQKLRYDLEQAEEQAKREYKQLTANELRAWDDEFFATQPTDAEVLIEYFKYAAKRELEQRSHTDLRKMMLGVYSDPLGSMQQAMSAMQQHALYQQNLQQLGAQQQWQSQQSAQQSLSGGSGLLSNPLESLGSSTPNPLGGLFYDPWHHLKRKK